MYCPIHLTEKLINTLIANGIKATDYMPAYGGESVGLDLFNASSESVFIPRIQESLLNGYDPAKDKFYWDPGEDRIFSENFSIVEKEAAVKRDKLAKKTLISTGLHIALPPNYVGLLFERGSITKTPLKLRAGVIDPGYTGEIFVNMVNLSDELYEIEPNAKLPVQLLIVPVGGFRPVTKTQFDEYIHGASRNTGMIGSSD